MLTLNKILKTAAIIAAMNLTYSCGREDTCINPKERQTGCLTLDFCNPEYKGAANNDEDKVSIIGIYIFGSRGEMVKSRILYERLNECNIILDKGRYEYRILTGKIPGEINSLQDYDDLLVDFYANIYRDSFPGFAMTAEGIVDVHEGDNYVNVKLTRLCSRVSIKEIAMRCDIPGVKYMQAKQIYIHNAPTCVHTDGSSCGTENGVFNWWDGKKTNFTNDESIFKCTVAGLSGELVKGQTIYPESILYCLPTIEPVNNGDFWTDSYLVLEMEAVLDDNSRQLHYYRKAIHLQRNVNLECRIAIAGQGSPSPEITPPQGDDFECLITVLPWTPAEGYGHSDQDFGPMDYSLTLPSDGNDGSIHFNCLYGEPRVISSDRKVLDIVGAGRDWIIINTGKGRARLELHDGYNTEYTQELEY